jgi:hypothetical protein
VTEISASSSGVLISRNKNQTKQRQRWGNEGHVWGSVTRLSTGAYRPRRKVTGEDPGQASWVHAVKVLALPGSGFGISYIQW